MLERRDEIATVIVQEIGENCADAQGEIDYAAGFLRWYSEEAVRISGGLTAVGVAVLVTPWNFPAAMITRKVRPALAAGCTVVVKPASDIPLTALLLGELMTAADVPDGVINVVPSHSSTATVGAMLDDPRVRKVSFTGSTQVGRTLLAAASGQVLNCSMELGGNAPFVVLPDADLEQAFEVALVAKMRNGGESPNDSRHEWPP